MNVAIAGYGNLGKALERQISKRTDMRLTHVFSRRDIGLPTRTTFDEAPLVSDVDVCFLALGSYNDLSQNIEYFRHFNIVDCFDNHDKFVEYKRTLESVKPDTISLVGVGWDPGILSACRALFFPLGDVATVWGRGQSMGHGNALRSVDGVIDGVQFTCPVSNAAELFDKGETRANKLVKRLCYVACRQDRQAEIARRIKQMPDYFADYETDVEFVSEEEVARLRQDNSHCGAVYAKGTFHHAELRLEVTSNADFTAAIMINCALAIPKLAQDGYKGAYDPLDIPLRYFCPKTVI